MLIFLIFCEIQNLLIFHILQLFNIDLLITFKCILKIISILLALHMEVYRH